MRAAQIPGKRFGRYGIFADAMGFEAGKGLERSRECKMRSKRVIDIGHALGRRVIRYALRWSQAADATAIDLDISDLAVFHEMLGHIIVVRSLAARKPDRCGSLGELSIGIVSTAVERLFKPRCPHLFQHRKPRFRGSDIFPPDLPCIDEERALRAYAFTRRCELIAVRLERTAAERAPTAFDSGKSS